MNQRIIYSTPDGGVAVVIPTGELSIEEVLAKDIPAGVSAEVVNVTDIPSDRTFRDAWEKSGKSISHNLSKAKDITHGKRRIARAAAFAPLDLEATIPAKAAQAEAARQAIRDKYAAIQTRIDAASSVDALKTIMNELG